MCSVRAIMGFDHSFVRVIHTVRLQLQRRYRLIQVERLRDVTEYVNTYIDTVCNPFVVIKNRVGNHIVWRAIYS